MSNIQSQQKIVPNQAMKSGAEQELFPVWVGNLVYPLTEAILSNMFNNVGPVHSVKLLINKRCAFVNYTKRDHCDEAIRCLHGSDLNGMKIAVRYPDRIPPGMGISRSALKAEDLQDENMRRVLPLSRAEWDFLAHQTGPRLQRQPQVLTGNATHCPSQ
ncbi:hypothetical protein NQZ68_040893 [Dissostichus eleginoides]|nr:hypothetical protein NQZ68_040893 [Dissostichus eleginoides]